MIRAREEKGGRVDAGGDVDARNVCGGNQRASGGMMTGLAAVGIDPAHFNLQTGVGATGKIAGAAAMINAVIGVAAYLQKSPLPEREKVEEREEERRM